MSDDFEKDIAEYKKQIDSELLFKLRMSRIDMITVFDEHFESQDSKSLNINFFQETDILSVNIDNVWYFIYYNNGAEGDWVIWNDTNNLEIVLYPDWTYEDLVGGIALLTQGSKARLWKRRGKTKGGISALSMYFKSRIKGIRLRDPNALFL